MFTGLACGHTNCDALFSDLDDAVSHANGSHAGVLMANTCTIQEEVNLATGEVKLVRVLDEPRQNSESTMNRVIIGYD